MTDLAKTVTMDVCDIKACIAKNIQTDTEKSPLFREICDRLIAMASLMVENNQTVNAATYTIDWSSLTNIGVTVLVGDPDGTCVFKQTVGFELITSVDFMKVFSRFLGGVLIIDASRFAHMELPSSLMGFPPGYIANRPLA